MSTPQVSIVIRCCNEEQHIGRLLAGILEQSVADVEIIVVDSGSSDATLAIASRYPVNVCNIKREAFSFGRSLNIGCAAASADHILIASAHVYPVYKDWIVKMIEPFADPGVALVYGKQRGDERTNYAEHQIFEKLFPERAPPASDAYFCNNANAAIRRRLWQEQPYDETLTGLEDLAWAKAITRRGYQVAYQSEASVIHVHDEKLRQIFNRYRREAIALKTIAPGEKFGMQDFLTCYFGNVASDLRHAHREGRLREVLPGVLGFRLMQFWGTYAGYAKTASISDNLKRTFYYPTGSRDERDSRATDERAGLRIPYSSLAGEDEP